MNLQRCPIFCPHGRLIGGVWSSKSFSTSHAVACIDLHS